MIVIIVLCLVYEYITFLFLMEKMMETKVGHYETLKNHLVKDVASSLKNIRVISYTFVSVLLIGGAGVWMPWMKNSSLPWLPGSNVFTYVFALLGALLCNRLYFNINQFQDIRDVVNNEGSSKDPINEINKIISEFDKQSILSSWGMMFGSIILLLVSYSYVYHYNDDSFVSLIALILSITFYLVSTAKDIDDKTDLNSRSKDKEDSAPIIPLNENENTSDSEENMNSNFFQSGE